MDLIRISIKGDEMHPIYLVDGSVNANNLLRV